MLFDDEGVATKRRLLIDEGTLRGSFWDRKNAALAGRQPTGNGYRGYDDLPRVAYTNLVIEPGDVKDLVAETRHGILVDSVMGTFLINRTTGDFSLSVETGWAIERGQQGHAVKGTMIAGNFFEALKQIAGIERKQTRYMSTIAPRIAFPVRIVGK